jgi:hypothetical protein
MPFSWRIPERVREVGAIMPVEAFPGLRRHDLEQRLAREIGREGFAAQRRKIAPQADARRVAGDEVQVGPAPFHHLGEELVDLRHGPLRLRRRR